MSPHQFTNATNQLEHLPLPQSCLLKAPPTPPGTIDSYSITVNTFSIQFNTLASLIQMNVTWDPPKRPYGSIINYQVRVLYNAAKSTDKVTSAMEVFKTPEDTVSTYYLIAILIDFTY